MYQIKHDCNELSKGTPIIVRESRQYEIQGMFHIENMLKVSLKCDMCGQIEELTSMVTGDTDLEIDHIDNTGEPVVEM